MIKIYDTNKGDKFMSEKIFKVYHSPGEIIKVGHYRYQDQLSEEYCEFTSQSANKYLRDKYNLSIEEYYNIVVYGCPNKVILCPNCGKNSMKFKGLSKGWSIYCNQSCITTYRLLQESKNGINPFQDKDFIEKNRVRASEFQKERMKSGKSHLLTKKSQMTASRNSFIKNHVNEECLFYIARIKELPNLFKIGICSTSKASNRQYYKSYHLYNHHVLMKGTAEVISLVEFNVKMNICEGLDEIIKPEDLRKVFELIRSINNHS